jgi:hypothetical protein
MIAMFMGSEKASKQKYHRITWRDILTQREQIYVDFAFLQLFATLSAFCWLFFFQLANLKRGRPTKGQNRPNKMGKIELKF